LGGPDPAFDPDRVQYRRRDLPGPAAERHPIGRRSHLGADHRSLARAHERQPAGVAVSFDLNLSLTDLLLMLPELWLTVWICVVLGVNFMMPRVSARTISVLSVAGMVAAFGCV